MLPDTIEVTFFNRALLRGPAEAAASQPDHQLRFESLAAWTI